jgi:hypothetical protein
MRFALRHSWKFAAACMALWAGMLPSVSIAQNAAISQATSSFT